MTDSLQAVKTDLCNFLLESGVPRTKLAAAVARFKEAIKESMDWEYALAGLDRKKLTALEFRYINLTLPKLDWMTSSKMTKSQARDILDDPTSSNHRIAEASELLNK